MHKTQLNVLHYTLEKKEQKQEGKSTQLYHITRFTTALLVTIASIWE